MVHVLYAVDVDAKTLIPGLVNQWQTSSQKRLKTHPSASLTRVLSFYQNAPPRLSDSSLLPPSRRVFHFSVPSGRTAAAPAAHGAGAKRRRGDPLIARGGSHRWLTWNE